MYPDIRNLEIDLWQTVAWAEENNQRCAFTLSNAGAYYFEDRCDLELLHEINWDAVHAHSWQQCQEGKQAEFLIEQQLPWELVSRIGLISPKVRSQVRAALAAAVHSPAVEIIPNWYY